MKTIHLNSHELVKTLDDDTVQRARALRARDIIPHLAVVAVGDSAVSTFVQRKQKHGLTLGIEVSAYQLPEIVQYSDVESVINFANDDAELAGVIIQLPMAKSISTVERDKLLTMVNPKKDVDALGGGKLVVKAKDIDELLHKAVQKKRFVPTTAASLLLLAQQAELDLQSQVVVVGKGLLVGNPLHEMLNALGVRHEWVDKTDKGYKDVIKSADVIFSGTDTLVPFLNKRLVKPGVAILAAGNEIDHESVDGHAAVVTAKIGSVGPLTISLLMQNTVRACEWQQ